MRAVALNWRQRIGLETLWLLARGVAVLPYWVKFYLLQNLLFVLLYYCLRYRRNVVMTNLRNSFPEKSEAELKRIGRKFYLTLAELFVDTLDMAHMPPAKAKRVLQVDGLEAHAAAVQGRDWIALMAHFGCWEFGSYWGYYEPSQMLVAVYHPLRNKVAECFYQRLRNNPNSMTVAMRDCLRFYLQHRGTGVDGKRIVMGLIADQNAPLRPDSHWFDFLHQDTIFFDGGEQLARRFRMPVYFVRMDRVKRGRYRISFELIYDGVEEVEPNEITGRYVRKLEEMIGARPELWLWSHRRWKVKRPQTDAN